MHTHYQVSTQHLPVLGTSGDFVGRCVLQRRDFFSLVLTLASSQHKPTIIYCGKPERIRFRSGIAFNTVGAVLESWFGLQGLPLGLPPTLLGGSVLFPCLLWF